MPWSIQLWGSRPVLPSKRTSSWVRNMLRSRNGVSNALSADSVGVALVAARRSVGLRWALTKKPAPGREPTRPWATSRS